ncbi:hypothetical protein ACFQJC_17475 [Haloferax namakaokahaiae]|uniref:Amphi-Trp domain-containing protein n=1 Tax=Haloferax namakaokahaiae TaxID=1748331 RepID=A0ABD5ZJ39_9EURY
MAQSFEELLTRLIRDVELSLNSITDAEINAEHVESAPSKNEVTLTIRGDVEEMFPRMDDVNIDSIAINEVKISVSPNPEYIDFRDVELPDC